MARPVVQRKIESLKKTKIPLLCPPCTRIDFSYSIFKRHVFLSYGSHAVQSPIQSAQSNDSALPHSCPSGCDAFFPAASCCRDCRVQQVAPHPHAGFEHAGPVSGARAGSGAQRSPAVQRPVKKGEDIAVPELGFVCLFKIGEAALWPLGFCPLRLLLEEKKVKKNFF